MIDKISGSSPAQPPADSYIQPLATQLRTHMLNFIDQLEHSDLENLAVTVKALNALSKEAEEC